MTEPDDTTSNGALIESLTRRAAEAVVPQPYDLADGTAIISRVLRDDERMDTVNLEKWLPEPTRNRGTVTIYDPTGFISYVQRLGNNSTTVWGDEDRGSFTAVFNDHADQALPGWRDHTARLQLKNDPEWVEFLKRDGAYVDQLQFAEFLQDYSTTFVEPDGATLLEVASSFKAHRKAEFSSGINLSTGDVQLTYNEETTAKTTKAGQIEVPREFVIKLSPFLGMLPVEMKARLRWTIDGGSLQIGYKLHRPDLVKRDAFAAITFDIHEAISDEGMAVFLGSAPSPVTPQS